MSDQQTSARDHPNAMLFIDPPHQAMDMLRVALGLIGSRLGRIELSIHLALLAKAILVETEGPYAELPLMNQEPGMPSLLEELDTLDIDPWIKDFIRERADLLTGKGPDAG